MKKPFLIALDMDGTLLNSKKVITKKTLNYLRLLSRVGHKVVLASGRPSRALKQYYEELRLSSPLICYNGAYIFSPCDETFKPMEFEFPKEEVKKLYADLKPYIKNVMCETDTDIWLDKEDIYLAKFFWYEGMNLHYGDLTKTLDKNPMTLIVQTPEGLKGYEPAVSKIVSQFPEVEVRFWTDSPYFEIFYRKVSKGAAIKMIAEHYDIPKERIVVFGDAENDVEMFSEAGYSVAMVNGKEQLKKHAAIVSVKNNDEDGIYYTLRNILHGEYRDKLKTN